MNYTKLDFKKVIDLVLPFFIQVYDEEYDSLIPERLSKVAATTIDSMDRPFKIISEQIRQKQVELTIKFLTMMNIQIPENLIEDAEERVTTDEIVKRIPTSRTLLEAVFGTYIFCLGSLNYLDTTTLLPYFGIDAETIDYEKWKSTEDAQPILAQIDAMKKMIKELEKEFRTYISSVEKETERKKYDFFQREIELANYIEFLNSIISYMSQDDLKIMDKINATSITDESYEEIRSLIESMTTYKLIGPVWMRPCIKSFNEDAERKLTGEEPATEYEISLIKEDRRFYYKTLGLCTEENADTFLESKEEPSHRPSLEMINDILTKKDIYKCKKEEELIQKTTSYDGLVAFLTEQEINDPEKIAIRIIKNNASCLNPAIGTDENGDLLIKPLVLLSLIAMPYQKNDLVLIHELNHTVELLLVGLDANGEAIIKSGFDGFTNGTKVDPNGKRKYELLNEVFNELLACEITDAMHASGIYILDDYGKGKTRRNSYYQSLFPLVTNMWKLFRPIIIKARIGKSVAPLTDTIGLENFEEMNRIVNDFYDTLISQKEEADRFAPESKSQKKIASLLKESASCTEEMKKHALNYGYIFKQTNDQSPSL